MKTISVQMSDVEYDTFGLSKDRFFFSEIADLIERQARQTADVSLEGMIPPRRNGSLTEAFGIWENDAPFDETNYRDILWQPEKNIW